ncbi:hypothetical protein Q1W73_13810 [Asticcacaulis sp. ZE23SCel15]|uniref:hypothetical protein n=1 Tax=Asticcacaulis sp. ZE23SCel15 TaxID=3059027 RepID=UPI00265FB8C4|nr:hypothetical protein [Asticcacaulis sp. ZE23SCel15]WKL56736.1 hypothetical protein Q1W73_13810 [Asticcacaulis sp. ZE23SCel15]
MTLSLSYQNEDRVSHKIKGLGTVTTVPDKEDLVVRESTIANGDPDVALVVWDDARYSVTAVPAVELEKVPDASAAISSGV